MGVVLVMWNWEGRGRTYEGERRRLPSSDSDGTAIVEVGRAKLL